jgi:hypothetical protein
MSAPDIFFLRFQNAPWSDPCFMSLGRLLALSQRVESHCRSLALYVKMRLSAPSPLESEEALHAFCEDVSVLSKKPMPSGEAYRTYSERLVTWVCNTDNGDPW